VSHIITHQFTTNPGKLSNASWLPTTHAESIDWLREFLKERFVLFGDYEDALTDRSNIVFHSAISPMLNNGLLTPKQVLAELENYLNEEYGFSIFDYDLNKNQHSPSFLNSIEGFVRQLIGWREWIRIMYLKEYEIKLSSYNFFKATNPLPPYFWDLNPDDPAIKDNIPLQNVLTKIDSYGWSHHIERLMVLSNWMLLNEYDPIECLDWFKAMYVDAYDWVMVPNVLGMGLFADGGIFATKPYVAGGNYLKKMSDYPDSKKWESIWTDKFWNFLIKHQEYFKTNPRMNMLIQTKLKK
jgi:deoxyribodipyrimidine photolyase-related protein